MSTRYQPRHYSTVDRRAAQTVKGYQIKRAPSTAKHPDWQTGPQPREDRKQAAGTSSWWATPEAQTREGFRKAQAQEQRRLTGLADKQQLIAAKDLER